jgi:endonuclease-3
MKEFDASHTLSGGKSELALQVHEILCGLYQCPIPYFHHIDPLSELVSSLLSHRTRNHDSGTAFKALRARFPAWDLVRDAPLAEVQEAISAVTWPEQKAPRLQAILCEITARLGNLSLEFLGSMPVTEARAWLESLPGVGPKTSAAVLLFSTLRIRALPVDSHHYRVAMRLGLISEATSEAKSHKILEDMLPAHWDAQQIYDNHEVMMFHGQRVCFWRNPDCEKCVLLHLCPTGQARVAGKLIEKE